MSCNNVQILNFNHNIVEVGSDNKLIITDNVKCNSITIPQPVTNILQINSPGPQGQTGAAGASINTGSFITTSSFNAYTGSSTSQFSGTSSFAFTASYAMNGGGTNVDTGSFVTTSSFNAFTQSINTATSSFVTNSQTSSFVTTSSFNTFTASYNTFTSSYNTGSFSGSFTGSLQGTASWANSASVAISSSYAATASYVVTALTASYVTASAIVGTVTSASYAATASYAMNAGGVPGGSNTQIQFNSNGTFSGSSALTFNSGSNTLTLTGSLKITGSQTITGYTQYIPTNPNIDNSISASYIYVSGSTNDLYFAQNGNGYSNNVRLRWLEGGSLYTGILQGGILSSTPGTTTFKITSGSGLIVTMNASTGSEPYPTAQYISWPEYNTQPITYSGSAKITYVGLDSSGQIIQQVVPWGSNDINQWDNSLSLGVVLHLSGSVSTGVFNSPQIAYGPNQKTDDFFRAFGPLKISGHTLRASGSSPTLSIIKDAGTSYREGANYVNNPNHPSTVVENSINISKIYRYYISGSTPVIDTGVGNAGYAAIDSKNYVDTTTGQLALVGGAYWSIQRVFWVPNSPTNAFIVYYGNDRYRSLVDATNAKDSEPFIEAPNTAQNAIFLGYIIIQGGGSGTPARDLLNASEATIIPAGLFRNIGGIGSSGTNFVSTTLAGLADVSLLSNTPGDLLVYGTGTTWNNKKQLTGSYGLTGSLTVTQNISASSFTGSLLGTATTASYITSSNIVGTVLSASYAATASYVVTALTASYVTASAIVGTVLSASYAATASYVVTALTASYVTASNIVGTVTSASYAQTASYVVTALTASYVTGSVHNSTNPALSASYAQTASYVLQAVSASFATTASFALNAGGGSGGISQGKVVAITTGYSNLF
jgi:hypothetical protein